MQKTKAIVLTSTVVILGVVAGVASQTQPNEAGADTSPITTTLDNHEKRITNAENNIKVLQTATGSSDSPDNVPVPAVVTNTSTTSTATTTQTSPTPGVTVTSFREIVLDASTSDCEYTYSDDTTYQWHWKTINPQGAWVTDGSGQNGHWQQTTQVMGECSDKALGQLKLT